MYTEKPTECERVEVGIIQSSWQAETGPPTGAASCWTPRWVQQSR